MAIRDNFSYNDMDEWLNGKRVTEIECLVPDLTGVARGKILPRVKFTEDRGMRLPEIVLVSTRTCAANFECSCGRWHERSLRGDAYAALTRAFAASEQFQIRV